MTIKHIPRAAITVVGAAAALAALLTAVPSASAAGAAGAAAPRACTAGMVRVAFHEGQGAAGSLYGRLRVTNTSHRTCTVHGYGGVSYVGYGNGTQVGAAADRTRAGVRTLALRPGASARDRVRMVEAGNYSPRRCGPTRVNGFRVYLPGETHSLFVPHRTTGCSNPHVHLLSVTPFRR